MTKIVNRIPRNQETIGEICGTCDHAMSNHTLIFDTQDKKYYKSKCHVGKCKCKRFVIG